ncbi:MAG: cytochrome c biogenesis protein CcsA [Candidatus Tectimicrobiota bacterium]
MYLLAYGILFILLLSLSYKSRVLNNILLYGFMLTALYLVFIYVPAEATQGIVQKIFYFHVSLALTMFVAFFFVFSASIMYLWKHTEWWDHVALSAAELGTLFCTLVLITGPIWARPIWGTWWTWDPTLTLTLVLWLVYVAYLMLRTDTHDLKRARFAAVLGIVGFVDVPLIRWSVEKWRTLHPKPVVLQEGGTTGLTPSMLWTFMVCLGAFLFLYLYLLRERVSLAHSEHTLDILRREVDENLSR